MIALLAAGCSRGSWSYEQTHETRAPGLVLAAQLSPTGVTVDGVLDDALQPVDVDRGPDDRYGFRYQVLDASGDVLDERATMGPALVRSFLAYYSDVAGVDLLQGIPTLGRFPVTVPILDGGDHVQFQLRDSTGAWVDSGIWSYDQQHDLIAPEVVPGGVEVLHPGGEPADTLDVVIVGDGFTAGELGTFRDDADKVATQLLSVEPFASYADRISITRVDVASNESGASFQCSTCNYVDNAFGSIFPVELINRITGGGYPNRPMFQADQWKVAEALAGIPWDEVVVLVNSPQFGAMAIHYASVTTGVGDIGPTAVHELGHAFGMLGDEYVEDACVKTPGVPLPENISDSATDPPWSYLVDASTPLPTPAGEGFGVGAYAGAWNCPDLYRPEPECRMNSGHGDFCPVCTELLTRRLMRFGDPATGVGVGIDAGVVRIHHPLPDTVVEVRADGERIGRGKATEVYEIPRHADHVEVEVTWEPDTVVEDPTHDLRETWSFDRVWVGGL